MPWRGLAAWGFPLAGNLDASEGEARERRLLCVQGGSSRSQGRQAGPLFKSEEL